MRILRHDNHLLWFALLAIVGLTLYFACSYSNRVPSSDVSTHRTTIQKENDGKNVSKLLTGAQNVESSHPTRTQAHTAITNRNAKKKKHTRVSFDDTVSTHTHTRSPDAISRPQYVYLDLAKQDFLKDPFTGRVVLQLRPDVAPKTCANFVQLCEDKKYVNTPFHRVIKDFMLQGGDIVQQDGTGTYSIYGGEGSMFDDEPFVLSHDQAGVLSMANSGPNTNGSQFFITTQATPHLNGKHVVFGKVVQGMEFVHDIEREMTDANSAPIRKCYILNCGLLDTNQLNVSTATTPSATPEDDTHTHTHAQSGATATYSREPFNATDTALNSTGMLDAFPPSNMFGHTNTPAIEPSPFSL